MNILVIGLGYVGLTTGLSFAEQDMQVTGLDTNQERIQSLLASKPPFYEPGLAELLDKHLQSKQIAFVSDMKQAVEHSDTIFLCVGTPPQPDGSADLQYIQAAASSIGSYMNGYKLIVIKSTVPIYTNQKVRQWVHEAQATSVDFDVVSNPEFLREGSALHDTMYPDRIIIGSESTRAAEAMKSIYNKLACPIIVTSPNTAEMIKYASNAFLATKISYMNELARLCEKMDINISDVAVGMGQDHRIGGYFLQAGIGYGGSCFPKDIQALLYTAEQEKAELSILAQVSLVNRTQYAYFLNIWEQKLGGYANKTIAILGLSFKPNTDDLREAPSIPIIRYLLAKQSVIRVHDPIANLPSIIDSDRIQQMNSIEDTVAHADAVILCTEWEQYKQADWAHIRSLMEQRYLFDGRNALHPEQMAELGFQYYGIANASQLEPE